MRYFLFPTLLCTIMFALKGSSQKVYSTAWDTAKMRTIFNQAGSFLDLKPQMTDSLAQILYKQARAAGNTEYTGKAASLLSISNVKLRNTSSMAWYDTALHYLSQAGNKKMIAYTNLQIGSSFGGKLDFQSGTHYLLKAAGGYEDLKDSAMLISVYTALSNMFQGFGNFNSEKKYAEKAVTLVEQIHDTNRDRRWGAYALLGISYDDNKEYAKALATHIKNIDNAGNDWVLFLSYINVGVTLRKTNAYEKAESYFLQALPYAKKINDDNSFATVYDNLARTSLSANRYTAAKQYLDQALQYAQKTKDAQKLLDAYETGWLLGKATGDMRSALDFFTLRSVLKDSVLNAEKSRIVYNLQIKYETEEKEKENQRLQYVNALNEVEKKKAASDKRRLIMGSIATLSLISVLFVLLYRNRIIKNKLIEEQVFVKAIMEGEQNERIRIARDLHDSIGQILSVAKMNISTLHYQLPENKIAGASADLLDNALVELRNISHNLMPEDLNFGLFGAIENICENINTTGKTRVSLSVPEEIKQYAFEKTSMLTIYRIVQEVLNNMVKHAEANQIAIAVSMAQSNAISIAITDNGKGFDTNELNRSRGLGWKNIAARVRMLDGKMQVHSEQLTGTKIDITIPLA